MYQGIGIGQRANVENYRLSEPFGLPESEQNHGSFIVGTVPQALRVGVACSMNLGCGQWRAVHIDSQQRDGRQDIRFNPENSVRLANPDNALNAD